MQVLSANKPRFETSTSRISTGNGTHSTMALVRSAKCEAETRKAFRNLEQLMFSYWSTIRLPEQVRVPQVTNNCGYSNSSARREDVGSVEANYLVLPGDTHTEAGPSF
jgi:hypothetical protein